MNMIKENLDKRRLKLLIPELALIEDSDLRRKVSEVWLTAWRRGKTKRIEDTPAWINLPGQSLIGHTRAVVKIASELGKISIETHNVPINKDHLIACSILHDVDRLILTEQKGKKYVRSDYVDKFPHAILGAMLSKEAGIPEDIIHMVLTHSPKIPFGTKKLEGIIVQHADLVDVDIVRVMHGRTVKAKGEFIIT